MAAGLNGEYSDAYTFPKWQRIGLNLIGLFPQGLARFVISRFESLSGLDPAKLSDFRINQLVEERLGDYKENRPPFKAITIGSALGGASAHLALALGGPFLPQAFVLTLRGGSFDGDILTYYNQSAELAQRITENNPSIFTIHHYDPVHDEWMTRYVNHLRFKLLDLPEAYKEFIDRNLAADGVVCYLDCQAQWLRYRIEDRRVFQVGGWGDIPAEEFYAGSDRLSAYCRRIGLKNCRWQLPEFDLENGPESEWGSESSLADDLRDFCERKGIRFLKISLPKPEDFSTLAYRAIGYLLEVENRSPNGVLIEMFSQFDATACMRGSLLPLWLVFNTQDSLRFLLSMKQSFPAERPVWFSPLATFTQTPDIVAWQDWENVFEGTDWRNIGARASHYPADSAALTSWANPLRKWVEQHPNPIYKIIPPEKIQQLAFEITPN